MRRFTPFTTLARFTEEKEDNREKTTLLKESSHAKFVWMGVRYRPGGGGMGREIEAQSVKRGGTPSTMGKTKAEKEKRPQLCFGTRAGEPEKVEGPMAERT